jgi:hypothetical protein
MIALSVDTDLSGVRRSTPASIPSSPLEDSPGVHTITLPAGAELQEVRQVAGRWHVSYAVDEGDGQTDGGPGKEGALRIFGVELLSCDSIRFGDVIAEVEPDIYRILELVASHPHCRTTITQIHRHATMDDNLKKRIRRALATLRNKHGIPLDCRFSHDVLVIFSH